MPDSIPPNTYELLKKAVGEDINNYSIHIGEPNKRGEGFVGDMCFISLIHKNNGKTFPFVIKQAPSDDNTRKAYAIKDYFLNEIYFYENVWPSFQKFQNEKLSSSVFDKLPKCYITSSEDRNEVLVLENLKSQDFQIVDKKVAVDEDHFEFIFREYGKFHAISFAYKLNNPEEFARVSQGLKNLYFQIAEKESFLKYLRSIYELCLESLDKVEDAKVIDKFKDYVDNGRSIFRDSLHPREEHSVILHGDCWSNNMMFKHDASGKPIDFRLIDFQLSYQGNPVSDLSYCLYAGGSKKIFDKLDYLLKVYRDSLIESLEDFGCNTENVYSMEELKRDWRQYCKIGFTMGIVIWRTKLVEQEDAVNLADIGNGKKLASARFDEDFFKKVAREVIVHMYENDFL